MMVEIWRFGVFPISQAAVINHPNTRSDLLKAIEATGISFADIVSLVSRGRLGLLQRVDRNYSALSRVVIDAFLKVLGSGQNTCCPDLHGSLGYSPLYEGRNNFLRGTANFGTLCPSWSSAVRSRDPMLAWAARGHHAQLFRSSFSLCRGAGIAFDNLGKANGPACTLGAEPRSMRESRAPGKRPRSRAVGPPNVRVDVCISQRPSAPGPMKSGVSSHPSLDDKIRRDI